MTPRESNPEPLSVSIDGPHAVAEAVSATRTFAESERLRVDHLARLCIIVEELVANLYDHGGVKDGDQVRLSFIREPQGVRLSLVDPGVPFNPWDSPIAADLGQGGRAGIRLIRAWTELIHYRSSDEGNELELLLPIR